MFIKWEAVKKRQIVRLLYDFFMINIALLNIFLIAFDYTYLNFRDFYFHNIPIVTRIYDPLKGIEAHRFTDNYIKKADALFKSFDSNKEEYNLLKDELIVLSEKMIDDDPFKIAFKSGDLAKIKIKIAKFMNENSSKKAFEKYWELSDRTYYPREEFFNNNLKPLLETNYFRSIDTSGKFTDDFFYIDLAFIFLFLIEFFIMWRISVRKLGEDQKILYPIYHWYDIVSCLPIKELRFLRLFRFFSVYQRLKNSEIISFGDGAISKFISKYQNIIIEEISDQVTIKILSDVQDKIRLGVTRKIIEEMLFLNKEKIREIIIKNIKNVEIPALTTQQDEFVGFVSKIIEEEVKSTKEYKDIKKIPYVNNALNSVFNKTNINKIVKKYSSNLPTTITNVLGSEVGEKFLNAILEDIIETSIIIFKDQAIQDLIQDMNVQLLEEIKKSSYVKKWKSLKS